MSHTLVIGYGSLLHRDDAAGPRVAERVASWHRPDVRALAVHQLTPELAAPMSQAGRVIFVDATVEGPEDPVKARRLRLGACEGVPGHFSDPPWLLGLCQALFGRCPEAWLITIPATDLSLGEGLSEKVEVEVEKALSFVEGLVGTGVGRA